MRIEFHGSDKNKVCVTFLNEYKEDDKKKKDRCLAFHFARHACVLLDFIYSVDHLERVMSVCCVDSRPVSQNYTLESSTCQLPQVT